MSLLEARGVALVRGGRLLFDCLDILLGESEGLLLTGPNGSGKSSLLRLAAGLLRPSSGTLESADAALADENLALDRELPLLRALSFWGGRNLAEAMTAMALGSLAGVPVRLLSTGQRKRATLARVIASGAPLWLLDEPLNGLDRESVTRLDAAIADHRAGGGAIIVASHAPLAGDWRELAL